MLQSELLALRTLDLFGPENCPEIFYVNLIDPLPNSLCNYQKTFYKTFFTTLRPRLYVHTELPNLI